MTGADDEVVEAILLLSAAKRDPLDLLEIDGAATMEPRRLSSSSSDSSMSSTSMVSELGSLGGVAPAKVKFSLLVLLLSLCFS